MLSPPNNQPGPNPEGGAASGGAASLLVQIEDESARTAYPGGETLSSYTITVTKPDSTVLGTLTVSTSGSHAVILTAAPGVNDTVKVEGFKAGNVKIAEGSYTLPVGYTSGTPVTVTISPIMTGSGSVNLSVGFPAAASFTAPETEITAAEITLYASLADYQAGNLYEFKRYRKDNTYGAGTDFTGQSIPLNYVSLPSGNYVAKIEFFRGKFVKIKTLVQTILVRDGLTTNTWDGGGSALTLGAGDFASSNANLAASAGISITGTTLSPAYDPGTYSYSILKAWTTETPTLTITPGVPGQNIEATLNGTAVSSGSPLTLKKDSNTLVIAVTAPNGVTKQTYTVSYTYRHSTVWYVSATSGVSPAGNDTTGDGTAAAPYATVEKALDAIKASTAYNGGTGWPGTNITPVPAIIQISGTIGMSSAIYIQDTSGTIYTDLPPIILTGDGVGGGEISKTGGGEALAILGAHVILGDNLTITGGHVRVDAGSIFIMNGGTISGNTAGSNGGGVSVTANAAFTMNGGTISGNTAASGGGVFAGGTFTMNGGTISGNTANGGHGGGVFVNTSAAFTMNGGTISGNTAASGSNGGGVFIYEGTFTMSGGTISGNTAGSSGGGVYVSGSGSAFTMNEGSVSGNTAVGGGGVYVTGSGSAFIMNGGSVSENQTSSGGGVYVTNATFTMIGGNVSGNTADSSGGGVYVNTSIFTMDGGTISGNGASNSGGGVSVSGSSATFTMSNGSVSGNNSGSNGGGVYIINDGSFTMSGGTISGNTATGNGGGVIVSGTSGAFTMSGSALVDSGNKVYLNSGKVITLSGALTQNPAANIQPADTAAGTPLLANDTDTTVIDDIGAGTPPNYQRFLVDGAAGKIALNGTYQP